MDFTEDGRLDGHTNMERDSALLDRADGGEPTCRVYAWDGPWISLGKTQDPAKDLLVPGLVPWVMRPTGGKAVLHGHDVTVGLALPLSLLGDEEKLARSVRLVYRAISRPLIEALNACDAQVALAEDTPFAHRGPKTSDCFAHISPNDIVYVRTGMKACGCALRLTRTAVLVQASIPNGLPLVDPQRVFAVPQHSFAASWDSSGFAGALKSRLAGLENVATL